MDKKINVLVFPAGEINAVEVHDSLASCVNINLFGASSVSRHGPFIFKNYISGVPKIDDEDFILEFNKILKKFNIDVIFPTHDSVAEYFSQNQGNIHAKIIVGDRETSEICRDKQKTYDMFLNYDFTPKQYKRFDTNDLPIFIKPKIGQGSVGAMKINKISDVDNIDLRDYVMVEYLPGIEYTVDCFTDKNGELLLTSPRSRDRVMAGVSVSGRNRELTKEIETIASTINNKLKFTGLWFFQIKSDINGKFKLLEISTRTAGTMCLTRARGANLPLLSVYAALGYDVKILVNKYNVLMDRTLISRYKIDYEYKNVYFDFDDTLVINNQVHLYSIMFLYQCVNSHKNIYLITKHDGDIDATLKKFNIDKKMFKKIIHLPLNDSKSISINPEKAIFIDNSFSEREKIYNEYGIPVFDVDTIEVLLDWRI